MDYSISAITEKDRQSIIDIFNYYIENSFAAYPETKVPYEAFDVILQRANGHPTASVKDINGNIIGFGLLRAHNPWPTFSHVAEITYFISQEQTGKGIGKDLLYYLVEEAKKIGKKTILAHISSLNPRSIKFHKKNGFKECGRFQNVCKKNGKFFDVIWMQKML